MPSLRLVDPQLEAQKRALRLEIAQLRGRIAADSVGLRESAGELFSWRTHAARHPGWVLAGAFLVGLIAAGGVSLRGGLMKILGRLIEATLLSQADNVLSGVMAAWQNAAGESPTTKEGSGTT
jgi:hypothetical protein